MFQTLLRDILSDESLSDAITEQSPDKFIFLFEDEIEIQAKNLADMVYITGDICKLPQRGAENFLNLLLQANLFGRGTRNNILWVDESDQKLKLMAQIPTTVTGRYFKEKIEDVVTIVDFWRNEALKLETVGT